MASSSSSSSCCSHCEGGEPISRHDRSQSALAAAAAALHYRCCSKVRTNVRPSATYTISTLICLCIRLLMALRTSRFWCEVYEATLVATLSLSLSAVNNWPNSMALAAKELLAAVWLCADLASHRKASKTHLTVAASNSTTEQPFERFNRPTLQN